MPRNEQEPSALSHQFSAEEPRIALPAREGAGGGSASLLPYAELHCLSNFSFLRGASHPGEVVARAADLGYDALAITDRNSLAGVVRAHVAAREHDLHLIIGAEITPIDAPPIILLAPDRRAYAGLARLITRGRRRCKKGDCEIHLADIAELLPGAGWIGIVAGATERRSDEATEWVAPSLCSQSLRAYRCLFPAGDLYLAANLTADEPDGARLARLTVLSRQTGIPLVATNAVHYHVPERRYLHDVLTCIREKCTLATAGARLFANAERHLRSRDEIARRYATTPDLVARTIEIARRCTFSLDELRYEYPHELVPAGWTAMDYLEHLTWQGAERMSDEATEGTQPSALSPQPARDRYPFPASRFRTFPRSRSRIPHAGSRPCLPLLLQRELQLIRELKYEHYFLTVWDLVRFARSRGILCQGRGSAANSAVCYCLGVTAVDPARIDLLFERFVSRERNEPPDIDVDFEHERREEVFQYIYEKYGRERAAITAEVITYRPRSAVRDVGKVLGLSLDRVDQLAKALDWWSHEALPEEAICTTGLDPRDRTIQMLVRLVKQLLGFPRHLSQHVGGFVITDSPLCEIVPLENGGMPDRTFIQWDKDDIDALGILKVDCLALGMLTAIRKCFGMLAGILDAGSRIPLPQSLHAIPREDPAVYDLICKADTVGVFQIESRAQMSMLPRLKPRCFYDLVIEVAIVRPGPIQGGMVHPYLRRRQGLEPVNYPSDAVRRVLAKTLGVPLFQEQVMRLAVVAAGFSPGEADQLRRSMAAWGRGGKLERFQTRLIKGMLANGYTPEFAEQIFKQIRGFGEYGFPESHAASFALLVYASAWLKRYHPAAFCGAVLNSQPMGFYAPAQLVRDAQRHGVRVLPVDVNCSGWDCHLESGEATLCSQSLNRSAPQSHPAPSLRLGYRLVRGLSEEKVCGVVAARRTGPIRSVEQLARRGDVSREVLLRLAAADAFRSLGLSRRQALWQILSLEREELPLFADLEADAPPAQLPPMPLDEVVVHDYDALGLSLNAHPIGLVREELDRLRVQANEKLHNARQGQRIRVAGLVINRQHPSTAKGIVFMTLEDETASANLIIRPGVWERCKGIGRTKIAVIAEGTVERQAQVIHVQVRRLVDLSQKLVSLRHRSRDFR